MVSPIACLCIASGLTGCLTLYNYKITTPAKLSIIIFTISHVFLCAELEVVDIYGFAALKFFLLIKVLDRIWAVYIVSLSTYRR